jgi:nucleoside-diphosphate-sugar epimerase
VYGPRQRPDLPDASVIPRWMACLWRRVPAELYGSGRTARDFVFVDDAARAAADAVEAALAGTARGAINVGSGEAVRLEVLWHLMTEVAGRPGVLRRAPPRPGDLPYSRAEVGRARQLLGFAPGISLSEGLRRTWSWWAAGGVEASPSVPAPEPARVEAGGRPRSTMAARDPGTARPPRRGRGAGGRGSRP